MTDLDAAILATERSWWRYHGLKEQHVREQLGMGMVAYYAALNRLLDDPVAEAAEPLLVRRLRRLRDARVARRSGRVRGFAVVT